MKDARAAADTVTLARGAGLTLVGRLVGRSAHLLTQVVLARWLGPLQYGLYALGWTVLRMVGFAAVLGLDSGVVRFAALARHGDPPGLKGTILAGVTMAAAIGGVAGVAVYALAPVVSVNVFGKPELIGVFRWIAPALLFYPLMQVAAAATRASEDMRYSVMAKDLGQPLVNLGVVGVAFAMGWGLQGALAAAVLSTAVSAFMAMGFTARVFPAVVARGSAATAMVSRLVGFSVPAMLAGMFSVYLLWADRLMVGYFRPAEDLGVYQTASQFAVLFAVILTAVGSVFSPMIARLYDTSDRDRLEGLYRVATKWSLNLSLPGFVVIALMPRELLGGVFGPEYVPGWRALLILAAGQFLNVATGSVNALLVMTGHQKRWLAISGTALLADIALNFLLIPRWGLEGAAWATSIALGGMFIAGVLAIRGTLGIWPYDGRILKGLLAAAVSAAVLLAARSSGLGGMDPLVQLSVAVPLVAISFVAILTLSGFDEEDRMLFRTVSRRIAASRHP